VRRGLEAIVHVSSITALYRRGATVITEQSPVGESTSAYGSSKITCERYVRELIDQGARVAITYPATVLGPHDPAMSEGNQGLALFFNTAFLRTTSGIQAIDVRDLARGWRYWAGCARWTCR
jgi:nucleoside-diphosphate-sugar epimerase